MGRDFLGSQPVEVAGTNPDQLLRLLSQQNNFLDEISVYLRRQNADVLCSAVVKGAGQQSNSIQDTNSHEVTFQVGGKPVEIFSLLAFSTYTTNVSLSILSMANALDGIVFAATTPPLILSIPLRSVHIRAASATNPLIINGPADATNGGFFLYGFTIPDWDKIRNSIRE